MLNLSTKSAVRPRSRWFEKIMAAIALCNLILVLLDYSYIPLRDDYLKLAPQLTEEYGRIFKGIEPHRMTDAYLRSAEELEETASTQQVGNGVQVTNLNAVILTDLRRQSRAMIDENPFALADKTGNLERIKRRITKYVSETTDTDYSSAKAAFDTFWSEDYLSPNTADAKLTFFNTQIRPLIATNYYRRNDIPLIGDHSILIDRFWWIDAAFMALFALEFLVRTLWMSRRYPDTNWFDAILWRWYDIFLWLPFVSIFLPFLRFLRWFRIISVTVRINQSRLLNLEPLRNRITRFLISSVAVELTEVVVLRVIDQIQNTVRSGDARRSLLNPNPNQRYIDLNGVDEIQVITQRLVSTLLDKVIPKLQPDIEGILRHTIQSVLAKNIVYSNLQALPGMSDLSSQLTQQLSAELYTALYQTLADILQDEKGAELSQALVQRFGQVFRQELQQDKGINELESLLTVWLDEVKINYVQRLAAEDIETLRQETQKIYAITQKPPAS
ncbi:MAG: hypothetical protein AAGD25_21855 [Cyanobacteria bacterium P01_F01_bin.150]